MAEVELDASILAKKALEAGSRTMTVEVDTSDLDKKIKKQKVATLLLSIAVVILAVFTIVMFVQLNAPEPKDCSMWETGSFDYFYCLELD